MSILVLRRQVAVDAKNMIHLEIPPEMGSNVEVIVRSLNFSATEEEAINLTACAVVLEDDDAEDAIWEKYVQP